MLLFRDRFRSFFSFLLQFTVEKNCTIYAVCWCRLNRVINFVTCQFSYCTSGFDLSTFGGSEAQGPFWLESTDGSMQGPKLKRSFYRVFGCWSNEATKFVFPLGELALAGQSTKKQKFRWTQKENLCTHHTRIRSTYPKLRSGCWERGRGWTMILLSSQMPYANSNNNKIIIIKIIIIIIKMKVILIKTIALL